MTSIAPSSSLGPLSADLGPLTRPDGSAAFTHGRTCVLAAVYGPADVRPNKERTDAAHVAVSYAAPGGQPGVAERAREDLLARACRSALLTALHPRTAVNVSLQVLEEGSEGECGLAACVNAASLALADAAVDMRFLLGAVAAGVDEKTGAVLVGLEEARQAAGCKCVVTFVFESAKREVVLTRVEKGKCSEKSFQEMLAAAREASVLLFEFYRSAIRKKFSKE